MIDCKGPRQRTIIIGDPRIFFWQISITSIWISPYGTWKKIVKLCVPLEKKSWLRPWKYDSIKRIDQSSSRPANWLTVSIFLGKSLNLMDCASSPEPDTSRSLTRLRQCYTLPPPPWKITLVYCKHIRTHLRLESERGCLTTMCSRERIIFSKFCRRKLTLCRERAMFLQWCF